MGGRRKSSPEFISVRYGIGEWYGRLLTALPSAERQRLAHISQQGRANELCLPRQASAPGTVCNKIGGVCSLQLYARKQDGTADPKGKLVTLCPQRFWESNLIFQWVGSCVLGHDHPILIKEVDFLKGLSEADENAVGRIDMVLLEADSSPLNWCALELQAVYFSGKSMAHEFKALAGAQEIPFPAVIRRPDFRSSGPKRLMPQLQVKSPTLRRWGRKMAVVVDAAFFSSLGPMRRIDHLSNADIAWFVVDYDNNGQLFPQSVYCTTLESAVEGLTAGEPVSREAFEQELADYLADPKYAARGKVVQL